MSRHIQGVCLFQHVRSDVGLGCCYREISSGFVFNYTFYFQIILGLQRGHKESTKISIYPLPSSPYSYISMVHHYYWYIKIKFIWVSEFIWVSPVFPLRSFFCARIQSHLGYYTAFVQAFATKCREIRGALCQGQKKNFEPLWLFHTVA